MTKANNNEWGSNLSFLLAMIGSAVGLGNIWRYPYVLYGDGQVQRGAAFFIPYLTAVFLLGIPFLILEYAVGYNFKASFAKGLRKIHKKFEFLGWLLPLSTYVIMIYYAAVVGWIAIYVVLSFYKGWGDSPGPFFESTLLKASGELSGLGTIAPWVTLSMAICWVLIWFISHSQLEKGLGRVNKVLVPLLFGIMIFIVIYSFTLDGAAEGLKILFKPNWKDILTFKVWMDAFGQIIFSISLGLSMAYTYAGYAGKGTDLISNALIMITANCGFENFCALGVFSILGYMTKVKNIHINEIVQQGSTGLVFVAYPEFINILGKWAYVVGPAFFITVFFAGLTSILSMIEPLSFCIQNKFNWSRSKAMTVLIVIAAVFSLLFSTGYGGTLLGYVDTYINNILILFCIIIECFVFAWVFKIKKTMKNLNDRSKSLKVGTWWLLIVKYILPIFIAVVWVGGMIDIFKNGSVTQTVIFAIMTVIMFSIALVFTFVKPTNEEWDEAEERLKYDEEDTRI